MMEILVISLLILINGFFALSEIALVSSRKPKLEQMMREGRVGAGTALKLHGNSENFLSAIQVGITLIGIITGVYGGLSIADDITPLIERAGISPGSAPSVALTLTVFIITYFSIVIGELVPKTIALSKPEKIAVKIAGPVYLFSLVFFPFVKLLSFSTSLINRILGIRMQGDNITELELRQMLKVASHDGVIEKEQNLIHEKVFYFSDKRAKHIMTHRLEAEWIDMNEPPGKIREKIIGARHSRQVCSMGDIDNFQGILNIRDYLAADTSAKGFSLSSLLFQPIIVHESTDAAKVLNLFREKKIHFCIVVNEYGSFEGIITLHDILENLIGEIPEQDEVSEPDIFVRDDQSYLVSGDAPVEVLDGIFEHYLIDLENADYSTVAGFVLSKIDKLPQVGDKFEFLEYIIEIVDIDGRRIDKVLIRKKQ
jgi:putative hemolysin